jgi:hypothetical protein
MALGVTSFSFKKEVTKKVNLDVPSKTSLPPAVLQQTAGLFVCLNSSICGAYIPPRRWVSCWQELLPLLVACVFPVRILYQNANAKAEFA